MMLTLAVVTTVSLAVSDPLAKCCEGNCTVVGQEKYWSIAESILGKQHCGEACIDPSDYAKYHRFEKNLTLSTVGVSPCAVFGFTEYDSTPTHGFGPIQMTLDLYNLPEESAAPRQDSVGDFRKHITGSVCTGPGELCCPAPGDDVDKCPSSARTSDCDAKSDCCCG